MTLFLSGDIKPHELRAYLALIDAGYDFTVLGIDPHARAKGRSSPDVRLGGVVWELKCPSGDNPKKTISRNTNRAIQQMLDTDPPLEELRAIISSLETPLTDEQVLYQVERVLKETRENLVEVMVVKKTGEVIRVRKQEAEA